MLNDINLKELAGWIAEQLGDWSPLDTESKYNHALTHSENHITLKLWLSIEGGRLRVSADSLGLYEFTWTNERFPVITCSPEKTPPQIARDIERRVLPEYRALVAKLLERKSIHDERKRKQHACCQELADILQAEMREGAGRHDDPYVYCYADDYTPIIFGVHNDGTVHIEIESAPLDTAKQIAQLIKPYIKRQNDDGL